MSTRTRRLGAAAAALAAIVAMPTFALANTNPQIAATGGMSATLPLLGSSLTIDVTLDAVGNISSVALDPVGDFSATSLDAHAVTFEDSGGTAQVRVRAKGDRLAISAKAGSLDALIGSGTWSADVFGTGDTTTVDYTIGKAGDGSPTVTVDDVSVPAGIAAAVQPMSTSGHDGEQTAAARVDFTANGFVKRLTIKVSVDGDEDGGTKARLSITLTGKDRQRSQGTLAELAGPHTWNGALCDGTAVSATFVVGSDGSLTFGGASGAPATDKTLGDSDGHDGKGHGAAGVVVRFTDTKVSVQAMLLPREGDQFALSIKGKSAKCGKHDGQAPTVNAPVTLKPDTKRYDGGDHDGGSNRSGRGGDAGQDGHSGWDGHD